MSQPLKKSIGTITYPRTGKRGVPQQFPRRLYKMLQYESGSKSHNMISWSDSGEAFWISNVSVFSSVVLPVYFRTSKFSSFQRNLNLYGFSKVRRGPYTDMYAHPSFLRGKPELLSQLNKSKHSPNSKRVSKAANLDKKMEEINVRLVSSCSSGIDVKKSVFAAQDKRSCVLENDERDNEIKDSTSNCKVTGVDRYYCKSISQPSIDIQGENIISSTLNTPKKKGRIDILAFIMARVVEEDCAL